MSRKLRAHASISVQRRLSERAVRSKTQATSRSELDVDLAQGETLVVEKLVALYTSRDDAISEPVVAACKAIQRCGRFDAVFSRHVLAWKHLWRRFDVHLEPAHGAFRLNVPMLLRLNMFHLLQSASRQFDRARHRCAGAWLDGRGVSRPYLLGRAFHLPDAQLPHAGNHALAAHVSLSAARRSARGGESRGFRGAMFPWQSGSDGQEETQEMNLNPRSQRWVPDNSYLQRHVGGAIAYNVWQYFQVTHDVEFLQFYGAELILEIARFWSSIATFNDERDRYEIRGVMGPDEFHEAYPDAPKRGSTTTRTPT